MSRPAWSCAFSFFQRGKRLRMKKMRIQIGRYRRSDEVSLVCAGCLEKVFHSKCHYLSLTEVVYRLIQVLTKKKKKKKCLDRSDGTVVSVFQTYNSFLQMWKGGKWHDKTQACETKNKTSRGKWGQWIIGQVSVGKNEVSRRPSCCFQITYSFMSSLFTFQYISQPT